MNNSSQTTYVSIIAYCIMLRTASDDACVMVWVRDYDECTVDRNQNAARKLFPISDLEPIS